MLYRQQNVRNGIENRLENVAVKQAIKLNKILKIKSLIQNENEYGASGLCVDKPRCFMQTAI